MELRPTGHVPGEMGESGVEFMIEESDEELMIDESVEKSRMDKLRPKDGEIVETLLRSTLLQM